MIKTKNFRNKVKRAVSSVLVAVIFANSTNFVALANESDGAEHDFLTYEGFLELMESFLYEPSYVSRGREAEQGRGAQEGLQQLERGLLSFEIGAEVEIEKASSGVWNPPYNEYWQIIRPFPLPYGNNIRTFTYSPIAIDFLYDLYRELENALDETSYFGPIFTTYFLNRGSRELSQILTILDFYKQFIQVHGPTSEASRSLWNQIESNISSGLFVPPSLLGLDLENSPRSIIDFLNWGLFSVEVYEIV